MRQILVHYSTASGQSIQLLYFLLVWAITLINLIIALLFKGSSLQKHSL